MVIKVSNILCTKLVLENESATTQALLLTQKLKLILRIYDSVWSFHINNHMIPLFWGPLYSYSCLVERSAKIKF